MSPAVAPPRYSIIIPVYREQENINICLQHLSALRRIEQSEVILVDGDVGSTLEAIHRIELPFRLVEIVSDRGRGLQLDTGAQAASAEYLLFLHADTVLPKAALGLVCRTLKSYDAGAFSLGIIDASPLFDTWLIYVNGRKRLTFSPYGDQALFMTRATYGRAGGFPPFPIMEDVALTDRLKRGGFRLKLLHAKVLTSARRWRREGYFVNFVRNTVLYTLYRMGISPWTLAAFYRQNSDKIGKIG
ncbi:MAG: TIGR04283 family arsenosugar biosynthesis glycosyltransferase [Spirochaetaceae bacterium]|nr:MAG: TIGR04283 family arsenosugar biosynthesis glycosyltransferase [Spirochaetaceae bacterium]